MSAVSTSFTRDFTPDLQGQLPPLIDVRQMAKLLSCSPRHVHRLVRAGRCVQPVRLGALVRFRRDSVEQWIAAGCPAQEGAR